MNYQNDLEMIDRNIQRIDEKIDKLDFKLTAIDAMIGKICQAMMETARIAKEMQEVTRK